MVSDMKKPQGGNPGESQNNLLVNAHYSTTSADNDNLANAGHLTHGSYPLRLQFHFCHKVVRFSAHTFLSRARARRRFRELFLCLFVCFWWLFLCCLLL